MNEFETFAPHVQAAIDSFRKEDAISPLGTKARRITEIEGACFCKGYFAAKGLTVVEALDATCYVVRKNYWRPWVKIISTI